MIVLVGSIGGVLILAIAVVCNSGNPAAADNATKILNTLLPVFGTWVGTVLAFYFSKANFEAASKSISNMAEKVAGADDKLKAIPVKDKMRPVASITSWPLNSGDEDKAKVADIFAKIGHYERIPMFDSKQSLVYLVYRSMLSQFLGHIALNPAKLGKPVAETTLKDVLDSDPKLRDTFEKSFAFVAETATLADAKKAMDAVSKILPCNDVFVTKTGDPKEPIIGWVTDNTISENLKI
ncbi:MAG TPA: hypothetical protein VH255_03290 [Verrucomicrobiae bacterium]|jgi:hypothetical protein|nr:hypothetical protein [Verrucomicrobiae bacterium]